MAEVTQVNMDGEGDSDEEQPVVSGSIITEMEGSLVASASLGLLNKRRKSCNVDSGSEVIEETHKIETMGQPLWQEVFGQSVLWESIAEHLPFQSLKDCRQVCKTFNEQITSLPSFKGLARPTVRLKAEECHQGPLMHTSADTNMIERLEKTKWKNLKIDCGPHMSSGYGSVIGIQGIDNILKDLTSLKVAVGKPPRTHTCLFPDLSGCERLSELMLEDAILCQFDLSLCGDELKSKLQRLTSFHVYHDSDRKDLFHRHVTNFRDCFFNSSTFLESSFKSLTSLKVDYYVVASRLQDRDPGFRNLGIEHVYVVKIVLENWASLEVLHIHVPDAIADKRLENLKLPKLKDLSVHCYHDLNKIREFLLNQPDLECLEVKFFGKLTLEFLLAVQAKGSRLKKLHIKQSNVVRREDLYLGQWDFLRSLPHLVDFSLVIPTNQCKRWQEIQGVDINDVLPHLPTTIQRINIRGGRHGTIHGNGVPINFEQFHWENLQAFSIRLVPESFSNETLTYFATKNQKDNYPFPKLAKLEISNCPSVTDFGGEVAFWKGLHTLGIRHCDNISEGSFSRVLNNTGITNLCLLSEFPFSKTFIVNVLSQNSALEFLKISYDRLSIELDSCHTKVEFDVIPRLGRDVDSDSDAHDLLPEEHNYSAGYFRPVWDFSCLGVNNE